MKNDFLQEIIVSLVFIVLLVLLLNPFNFWMPTNMLMVMLVGLIIVFTLFASFVWRENAKDERELLHRMFAGRVAYLVGTGTLVLAIIIQCFLHQLDPWLVLVLVLMVLAKIVGIMYSRAKN